MDAHINIIKKPVYIVITIELHLVDSIVFQQDPILHLQGTYIESPSIGRAVVHNKSPLVLTEEITGLLFIGLVSHIYK